MRLLGLLLALSVFSASAHAQECPEYFTHVWGNPLDMNDSSDILNNIVPLESSQIGSFQYDQGIFSATAAGADPWFRLLLSAVAGSQPDLLTTRYGNVKPIDTSIYRVLHIHMNVEQASDLQVFWDKADGSWAISDPVPTTPGWRIYSIDLATVGINDGAGNNAWTASPSFGLRIDPLRNLTGSKVFIDYIELAPIGCAPGKRHAAKFLQPDYEGGVDYFTSVRGNPANMSSSADIDLLSGTSEAFIYPGKAYVDSGGVSRVGDYFEAINSSGNGDPVNMSVYNEFTNPIDANRFKIACYTLDLLRATNLYHSVSRVLWSRDGQIVTSQDILNRTTGESRYCLRLDETAVEENVSQPWRNNSDGSGINFWRIDAHEDSLPLRYRFQDIRLAADHEANQSFAIILEGDRDQAVSVLARPSNGAELTVGTLPANRSTDALVWNTSSLPDGLYTLRAVMAGNSVAADGRVVVNHGLAQDTQAPVLQVAEPQNGHRFQDILTLSGTALDERRLAAVEVAIDGLAVASFLPTELDVAARDAYPAYPYNSTARFVRSLDLSGLSLGDHQIKITAYDTAGNATVFNSTITRATDNLTAAIQYPAPNLDRETVPLGSRPKDRPPRVQLTVSADQGTLSYSVSGSEACPTLRLLASLNGRTNAEIRRTAKVLAELNSVGGFSGQSIKVPKYKKKRGARKQKTTIFFMADCVGGGDRSTVKKIDAKKIGGRKANADMRKILNALTKNFSLTQ